MKSLGCRRFSRLLSEMADREVTERESQFLDRHRDACLSCRREEEASCMSLDLLRGLSFDEEFEPSSDRRIVRRAHVAMVRDGVRYWSPALMGGLVAAGLLLAAVQAMTKPITPGSTPGMEAKKDGDASLAVRERAIKFTDTNLNRSRVVEP